MSRGEKIALIVAAMTGIYLLVNDRSSGVEPSGPVTPIRVVDRVMGYANDMLRYGIEQGVDPALVASVMTVESTGIASATGKAGEVGLMQVMPSTALWIARVTPEQLRDPGINIRTGTGYLRYCIDRKGGNVLAGVAGYNYGPDRVIVEGDRVSAPSTVLSYARTVLTLAADYQRIFRDRLGFFYENAFPAA